jgi:hypothetical protein
VVITDRRVLDRQLQEALESGKTIMRIGIENRVNVIVEPDARAWSSELLEELRHRDE